MAHHSKGSTMSNRKLRPSLALLSLFAACVDVDHDDAAAEPDDAAAAAPEASPPDAELDGRALVWRESPPERPVQDEEAPPSRLTARPSEPAPGPSPTTPFSPKADTLSADTPAAVAAFSAANEYHDRFGYSTAVGDFDDDGLDDLAIGAPFEDYGAESSGLVFLFQGTSTGLTPWALLDQIGTNERFDRFGWALTVGDFNGDGKDDLAASALNEGPGSDENAGTVFIYRGSTTGLTDWFYSHQESPALETNEDRDLFGYALSAGDYNGDGKDDLAVGAPGEVRSGVREGVVYLLAGGASGMTAMGEVKQGALSTAHPEERFGSALASGDLFGTSADELVVGAYNDVIDDWRGGSVFIYQGSGSGLTAWGRRDEWTLEENDDEFGRALAVADFDGDGRDDLAVGAPGENRDSGIVFLYRGTSTSLSQWDTLYRAGAQPGDRFGAALTAGRVDTDTKYELVVGSPRAVPGGSSVRAGVASVFFGNATTMLAHTIEMKQSSFAGSTDAARENFGLAVAIGHFRTWLYGDVAISAPDDALSGLARVGSSYVYKGTGSGASFAFTTSQKLVQN